MTILFHAKHAKPPTIDPGVLLIDGFLTEEDEQRILDEIEDEIANQQFRSLSGARAYLNTCCGGTAALNRLLRFTVRSSTALVSNGVVQFLDRVRQAAGTRAPGRAPAGTNAVTNPHIAPLPLNSPSVASSPLQ